MTFRRLHRLRRHGLLSVCLLLVVIGGPVPGVAQQSPEADEAPDDEARSEDPGRSEAVIPPQEPMDPREELFLAIELRDVDAARRALERGADSEISSGDPSPLATAALHDNLRMVDLLLDFGGDPAATRDSPLEEAVRNENARMVELLMRAGARVPAGAAGQELFRLAQRGGAAKELSRILLEHGADADQCLAAATDQARVELMKYCLRRGGGADRLPAELNVLGVALASGDAELVDLVLAGETSDRTLIGAFTEAVAAGRRDLVERALAAGATPAFEHVEAAIANGQPEIGLLLLGQDGDDDASAFADGDVEALIQRASDLGYDHVASALRSRSGHSAWSVAGWLPALAGVVVAVALILLLLGRRGRRQPAARPPVTARQARGSRPPSSRSVPPSVEPPATSAASAVPAASEVTAGSGPAPAEPSPAATLPVGAIPMMPSISESPRPESPPPAAPAAESGGWQVAPEPAPVEPAAPEPAAAPARAARAVASRPPAAIELRMPDVDLDRDADAVFDAARAAGSGESVRPDAPDRRQVVLVTPARVTMLHSCPDSSSLAPDRLAAAERLAGAAPPKNVAAIAYTDLDAMSQEISHAIPFIDVLRTLGSLGHAVWIFEGHVTAMAAGCRDADLLIVDDGMMPYLPGNWRSVATRAMRGSEVHIFERKTGIMRRLD